jgi:hypothetical protein
MEEDVLAAADRSAAKSFTEFYPRCLSSFIGG